MRITTIALCLTMLGCAQDVPPVQAAAIPPPPTPVPTQPLEDFDPFGPQPNPPTKDEYIADGGMVLSDESIARINAENARHAAEADAEYARRRAERKADARADRIVDAQRDTQRELQALRDDVNR